MAAGAYRLVSTGFTKVTVALNTPPPISIAETSDRQTALVALDVTRHGQLVGGPHAVLRNDLQEAVVVQDSREHFHLRSLP